MKNSNEESEMAKPSMKMYRAYRSMAKMDSENNMDNNQLMASSK